MGVGRVLTHGLESETRWGTFLLLWVQAEAEALRPRRSSHLGDSGSLGSSLGAAASLGASSLGGPPLRRSSLGGGTAGGGK